MRAFQWIFLVLSLTLPSARATDSADLLPGEFIKEYQNGVLVTGKYLVSRFLKNLPRSIQNPSPGQRRADAIQDELVEYNSERRIRNKIEAANTERKKSKQAPLDDVEMLDIRAQVAAEMHSHWSGSIRGRQVEEARELFKSSIGDQVEKVRKRNNGDVPACVAEAFYESKDPVVYSFYNPSLPPGKRQITDLNKNPIFSYTPFLGGISIVCTIHGEVAINDEGKVIAKFADGLIWNLGEGFLAIAEITKDNVRVLNREGIDIQLPPEVVGVKRFSEGFLAARDQSGQEGFLSLNEDKKSLKVSIPFIYEEVQGFRNGFAHVRNNKENWGLIQNSGSQREVLEPTYDHLGAFSKEGIGTGVFNGVTYVIDIRAKTRFEIPEDIAEVGLFSEGIAVAKLKGDGGVDSFSYLNSRGQRITAKTFMSASPFDKGLAAVRTDEFGRFGLIKTNGEWFTDDKVQRAAALGEGRFVISYQTTTHPLTHLFWPTWAIRTKILSLNAEPIDLDYRDFGFAGNGWVAMHAEDKESVTVHGDYAQSATVDRYRYEFVDIQTGKTVLTNPPIYMSELNPVFNGEYALATTVLTSTVPSPTLNEIVEGKHDRGRLDIRHFSEVLINRKGEILARLDKDATLRFIRGD